MSAASSSRDVDRTVVARVALGSAAVTIAIYAIPWTFFAYDLPGLVVFVATLSSASACAVSALFYLRHRHSRKRTDLSVAVAFGLAAMLEAVLTFILEIAPDAATVVFWSRAMGRTIFAIVLCVAAWRAEAAVDRASPVRVAAWVIGGGTAIIVWTMVWSTVWAGGFPDAVSGPVGATARTPSVLTWRLLATLALVAAAIGFLRKARAQRDPALHLLACGSVLLATARFHDFLYPSLHNDWLTTGDVLRVGGYWIVLGGLAQDLVEQWRVRGTQAAEDERRKIAAEIHDGLAQELAYISIQTGLAAGSDAGGEQLARLHRAAERALVEARRVIVECGTAADERSLGNVLDELGRDLEERYGCRVVIDVDAGIVIDGRTAHEVRRIAGEALLNAARHAHSTQISARLVGTPDGVHLTVADDGEGMAPVPVGAAGSRVTGGFGLTSMRDRAHRLGGSCQIISTPGAGTTVSVEVPAS